MVYRERVFKMHKVLYILCIYISTTQCIDSDYYYEDTELKKYELLNKNLSQNNNSLLVNSTEKKVTDESEKDDSVEDLPTTTENIQTNVKLKKDVGEDKKETDIPKKCDYRKLFKSILPNVKRVTNVKPPMDIFKEHDDFETESYLEQEEKFKTKDELRRIHSESQTRRKKKRPKKMRLHLIDYYSLEPAAAYVNPRGRNFLSDNPNIWYVTEDLPCWQLPILYGEFSSVKSETPPIFTIHRTNLKNIVHEPVKHKSFSKGSQDLDGQMFNKWCEIEPCYGDHTLCLFPDKTLSTFCETQYKVVTPTTAQQVELVNTINSMRNRIAMATSPRYNHLPTAANMQQMTYDTDLEKMACAWLSQCLPGPAPCSALDGNFVTMLECKKYMRHCCGMPGNRNLNCTPPIECFVQPVIGCIHKWYWSAGERLTVTDVQCGHIAIGTYTSAQLFWANSYKIGCATGVSRNGDVRVICNFAPGAPFYFKRKFYCGLLPYKDITEHVDDSVDVTNLTYLSFMGINLDEVKESKAKYLQKDQSGKNKAKNDDDVYIVKPRPHWGVQALYKIYSDSLAANDFNDAENGTKGMLARVVTQYTFYEESQARCDTEEPIYVAGRPASMCLEKGRRYPALCYHFGDPTPGFRLVAIIAPVTLFSLVLYDLFSSAVRQTI